MPNIITVTIPGPLVEAAKARGINISFVCREALRDVVEKVEQLEKETREQAVKQVPGTPLNTPIKGYSHE